MWTNVEEEATVESTIESLHASEQVQFLLYVAKPDHIYYYDFPVNYLRNLCIRHIKTSHFMFWLSLLTQRRFTSISWHCRRRCWRTPRRRWSFRPSS